VGDLPIPPGKPPVTVPDLPPAPKAPTTPLKAALEKGVSQADMMDYFYAQGDISSEELEQLDEFLDWVSATGYSPSEKNIDNMYHMYLSELEAKSQAAIAKARGLTEVLSDVSDERFVRYLNSYDANRALLPEYEVWYNGLSEAQKKAIIRYTDGAYTDMNAALRSGLSWDDYIAQVDPNKLKILKSAEDFQVMYDDMISAFDQAIIPEDIVLRGFHGEELYKMLDDDLLPDGYIIEESQFLSTSAQIETRAEFGRGANQIVYEIEAPKGSIGMHVARSEIGLIGETEIILPPGTQLEIIRSEKIQSMVAGRLDYQFWKITCRLIGQ